MIKTTSKPLSALEIEKGQIVEKIMRIEGIDNYMSKPYARRLVDWAKQQPKSKIFKDEELDNRINYYGDFDSWQHRHKNINTHTFVIQVRIILKNYMQSRKV